MAEDSASWFTAKARFIGPDGVGPFLIDHFEGSEALGRLFEYELQLLSTDLEVDFKAIIASPAAIIISGDADHPERVVHGVISRFTQSDQRGSYMEYRATLVPYIWFLTLTADCRIFQAQTVPQIVRQVLSDRGFDDIEDRLSSTYQVREYCVQYRETDFNFISRLLEDEGIYYYFEHSHDESSGLFKHVLVLCDSSFNHQPGEGCESLDVAPHETKQPDSVSDWSIMNHVHSDQASLIDFDFKQPRNQLFSRHFEAPDYPPPPGEIVDYPGGFTTSADGDRIAVVRAQEYTARRVIFRGVTAVRGLFAGIQFKLNGHPRADQNRNYLVIASSHSGWSDIHESGRGLQTGDVYTCSFDAIDAQTDFRPARTAPKPVISGPQTAMVVGKQGEEIWTDQYGRVKVKFHWDRGPDKDEKASCWIRVAQIWAGVKWGAMFVPRIGQEVIVEFLEGDPDRPLITGRVYNGDSTPPYDLPSHATVSTIKSMSSKGGQGFNEFRFQDKKGSEQLFLHAQRQMDVRVGASLYETVGGNREEQVGHDDKGDFNRLVANDINAHAKGGQYELVDKKLNQNVKLEVVEVFENNHTVAVTERQTLNAKEIAVEAKTALSIKGATVVVQGAQALSLKAGNIKVEGTQSISLKCGGSFIVLTPSGVFINGATVFINTGGAAQPADAPLVIQDPTIETPIDAAAASSAVPGQQVAGGGGTWAARTRTSRKVALQRAPEPPPPPPQGPKIAPLLGGSTDRQFIDIEWVEQETYCGGPATLRGTTKGYADNSSETAEVRNVMDGATVVGVPITITGNAYNQNVEVKDWLPRKSGPNYETFRDEDAFAAGKKTPRALKMKFIPSLNRAECTSAQFAMLVSNYECKVQGNISYVRGQMAWLIQLGNTVPAATGGQTGVNWGPAVAGSFSGSDWRFAKDTATGKVFWDGTAWQAVPNTWSDVGSVKLYGIGIWREGTANKAQFGNSWPDNIPAWGAPQQAIANSTLPTWTTNTNGAWTNKFDLRRIGCASGDQHCCRYSVTVAVAFTAVATKSGHTIVIGFNNGRSNAGAWSLGDTRPGLAPHEFGHHLGNPDEYVGGVGIDTSVNTDGATAGIDPTSLMGSVPAGSIPPIKARHLNKIKQHLSDMIQAQQGVAWTFNSVPHI